MYTTSGIMVASYSVIVFVVIYIEPECYLTTKYHSSRLTFEMWYVSFERNNQ